MSALPTSRESPVDLVSDFESPQYSPISDADDDEEEPEPEVLTGDHDTIVRAHAFMLLGKKNAKGCDKHVPGSKADKTCSYNSRLQELNKSATDGMTALARNGIYDRDILIIDTGASQDCLRRRPYFKAGSLHASCGEQIVGATGDTENVELIGHGCVELYDNMDTTTDASPMDLGKGCWYKPKLEFDLASVGHLAGCGYKFCMTTPSGSVLKMQKIEDICIVRMCPPGQKSIDVRGSALSRTLRVQRWSQSQRRVGFHGQLRPGVELHDYRRGSRSRGHQQQCH